MPASKKSFESLIKSECESNQNVKRQKLVQFFPQLGEFNGEKMDAGASEIVSYG